MIEGVWCASDDPLGVKQLYMSAAESPTKGNHSVTNDIDLINVMEHRAINYSVNATWRDDFFRYKFNEPKKFNIYSQDKSK